MSQPSGAGGFLRIYLYVVIATGLAGGVFGLFQPFYHNPAGATIWLLAFIAVSLAVNGGIVFWADAALNGHPRAWGWLLYFMLAAVVMYAFSGPPGVLIAGVVRLALTGFLLRIKTPQPDAQKPQ